LEGVFQVGVEEMEGKLQQGYDEVNDDRVAYLVVEESQARRLVMCFLKMGMLYAISSLPNASWGLA
jgi:hypothetical protein